MLSNSMKESGNNSEKEKCFELKKNHLEKDGHREIE